MTRTARALPFLAPAMLILALFVAANGSAARRDFPLDDAWIHQVYVRGLVRDGMPTYNPGEPEAGFSSPAWLVVSIPAYAVGAVWPAGRALAVKGLNLAVAALACGVISQLARRVAPPARAREAGLLGALLPWASPGFAFAAVSGMEVSLTTAVAAATLVAVLDDRVGRAAALLGVLPWCRPEGAVLSLVGWIALALRVQGRARARRAVGTALPGALLGALWVGWNLAVTGRPLPNTFYVKAGGGHAWERARYYLDAVALAPGLVAALLAAGLALAGVGLGLRDPSRRRAVALTLAALALPSAAIVLSHGLHRGVLFYEQRYFLPFSVFDVPLVAAGACELAVRLEARRAPPPATVAVAALALVAAAFPAWLRARSSYADHCADIARLHTAPALDARRSTAPGATLAVEGAGAARFFADRRVVDVLGLNTHAIAAADDRVRMCLIVSSAPSMLLIPSDWLREFAPFFEGSVRARYTSPAWSVAAPHRPRTVLAVDVRPGARALRWRERRFDGRCNPRAGSTP